ncbi:C-X-C motif chemokine 19 [Ictalurus punctatus]|uniref:C-X-C motif chemokine 19 n=1 Tax=Ictalurus punctatus TaxID=7998 RepID=A0A2D0RC28_ICTPU|nr:C-X-C motif chemokine 19 [Ictalurus punctatus]XP_053485521.1 C-X-C motif chemokine 19 [Ictalurus furcatus]
MRFFLLLALVTVSLFLTSAIQPLGKGYNSHCMCLKLESRVIPQHSLRSVEIFPRGSHCKNTEVIAGLVSGEKICLNPRTAWVKKLIQFIEKKERVIKKA